MNTRPLIDNTLLNSLKFKPPCTDPLKFIDQFESGFLPSVGQEVKSVWLRRFLPSGDSALFEAAFGGDINTSFDRLKSIFLSTYFRPLAVFRKKEMDLRFEDLSSMLEFVNSKIKVYRKIENLSEQAATERVFYELPPDLCDQFVRRKEKLNKKNLINFLTFSEIATQAQFRSISAGTQNVALNDTNNSRQSGHNQSMPAASSGKRSGVVLREPQFIPHLESETEEDTEMPKEGESESSPELELLTVPPSRNPNRSAQKRNNPDDGVVLSKKRGRPRKNKKNE